MESATIFLILGLCGFGVVVLGLIVFVFSIIFRFTGHNFMGFLSLLARNSKDDEDAKPVVITHGRPNLRAIADAQDFDAALAKHVVQDEGVITNASIQAQNNLPITPAVPPEGFEDVANPFASRRRRFEESRRQSQMDDDDDILGGLMGGDS